MFSSCAIEALTSFMWNSSGMMDREEKQHRNNMTAAKAGVHRGLLVTKTGYFIPFSGSTKGKNDPNAVPSPSGPPPLVLFATG